MKNYQLTEHAGFSLATITTPHAPTVTAYISCDLHESQTTKNHAAELIYSDMLLSGAGKYTRETFLDAVNQLGASIGVSIADGMFSVSIRAKADVFKKVLTLAETMLETPSFDTKELARVKQTVIGAIKESREDSRAIAHEELRNAFYGPGDRRITPNETALIAAVKSVTKSDLQKIHSRVHHHIWTASIAGNAAVITDFTKGLKKLTASHQQPTVAGGTHVQHAAKKTLLLRDIPSRQNIDFSFGAPVPITLHHPDYLPLMFGLAVLGKWGGFAGRLMSTVREQEGLTYGIYAKGETFLNSELGYWRIMTFFAPEKTLQGVASTMREITTIFEHGITKEELAKFKQIIATADALKNDSTASLLGELHSYHLQQFSLEEIVAHKKRMTDVTLEEVNESLKKYLNPALVTISAAGPVKKVEKELKQFMK